MTPEERTWAAWERATDLVTASLAAWSDETLGIWPLMPQRARLAGRASPALDVRDGLLDRMSMEELQESLSALLALTAVLIRGLAHREGKSPMDLWAELQVTVAAGPQAPPGTGEG